MSIYTGYDPLLEVIVGDCHGPGDLDYALPDQSKDNFNIILKETKEDLDSLSRYLESMGVKVHRPNVTKYNSSIDLGNFQISIPTSPVVPRDQYLVYGDTIYQTYTSMPDRYLDSINYYDIFKEMFDQGYNWISQPPPILTNLNENDKWWDNGQHVYKSRSNILWHTATFFKCGDAIIYNELGPGTASGLEWMQRNTRGTRFVKNDSNHAKGWGHIDHGFFMTDDNTVICSDVNWVPGCLKEKTVIEIGQYIGKIDKKRYGVELSSTAGKFSPEWLERWLLEWKGYTQEVNFDTNVLVIDNYNVVFSHYHKEMYEFLRNKGITAHYCPQRHGLFWESGVHCLTLDIKRKGENRKIC
jgi:glycine amidinotransferase